MLSQLIAGELSTCCVTPLGEDSWKLAPGFHQTSPHVPFPSADFALYPFTVVNLSHMYHYMLSPMSPPSKSSRLEVVLGTPDTIRLLARIPVENSCSAFGTFLFLFYVGVYLIYNVMLVSGIQ